MENGWNHLIMYFNSLASWLITTLFVNFSICLSAQRGKFIVKSTTS